MRLFCCVILSLLAITVHAQNLFIKKELTIGGSGIEHLEHKLIQASNGDFLLLATTQSRDGDIPYHDAWAAAYITRFDKNFQKIWTRTYGFQVDYCEGIDLIEVSNDHFIVTGRYTNAISRYGLRSAGDIWAFKIDGSGNRLWQRFYGGMEGDLVYAIANAEDDGFILAGETQSTDLDMAGNKGRTDAFLLKLDSAGNIVWKKLIGGSSYDAGTDLVKLRDGNYAFVGRTESMDGDFPDNNGTTDGFIVKLNPQGGILWKQCYGTESHQTFWRITEDAQGNLYAAGHTDLVSIYSEAVIVKYSPAGAVLWEKTFTGAADDDISALTLDKQNKVIVGGFTFSDDGDFSANAQKHSMWVAALDQATMKAELSFFGGKSRNEKIGDLITDQSGQIIFTATVKSDNPFTTHVNGTQDSWIVLLGAANRITGRITSGADNQPFPYGAISIQRAGDSQDIRITPNAQGYFTYSIDTGAYNISFEPFYEHYKAAPDRHQISHADFGNTDSLTFSVLPEKQVKDLWVSVLPLTAARPGFNGTYKLIYGNKGTVSVESAHLSFILDSRVSPIRTTEDTYAQHGDTLSWQLPDLSALDSAEIILKVKFNAPPALGIGDSIISHAVISPLDIGEDSADNFTQLVQVITGSYDPNDKSELHGNQLSIKQYEQNEPLQYLIRFQNTGNDTAFNIVVRDTLDEGLEPGSLKMISSSHSYELTITGGRFVEWSFKDILLVDSNRNEPLSHGYISFTIRPVRGLSSGDRIFNKASIYFDFNPPIVTNEQLTEIGFPAIARPAVSGFRTLYCHSTGSYEVRLTNKPDDANAEIRLDNQIIPLVNDSIFAINTNQLDTGNHQLDVKYISGKFEEEKAFHFSVQPTSALTIKLRNSTPGNNLNDPVTIVADMISGSADSVLYTFSYDREFTRVVEPTSPDNSVTIFPQNQPNVSSWIYARATSDKSCILNNAALDSINISRKPGTGITDPEYPSVMITAGPNPVTGTLIVNGLQTLKTYIVSLYNADGKIMENRRGEHVNRLSLATSSLSPGIYFMKVFDATRNKSLGIIRLVKK